VFMRLQYDFDLVSRLKIDGPTNLMISNNGTTEPKIMMSLK
jgi:hypothetical protein